MYPKALGWKNDQRVIARHHSKLSELARVCVCVTINITRYANSNTSDVSSTQTEQCTRQIGATAQGEWVCYPSLLLRE